MIHCLLTLSHMTNSSDCSAGRLGTWFIIVSIGTSDCLAQTRLLTMNNYLILDTTISFMQDWEWIYTFAFHSYSRVKIRPITSKPTSCRQATCFSFQNSSFWPRFFNQMIYLNTHGLMTWTTINDSQLNQILPLVACKNLEFTNDHRQVTNVLKFYCFTATDTALGLIWVWISSFHPWELSPVKLFVTVTFFRPYLHTQKRKIRKATRLIVLLFNVWCDQAKWVWKWVWKK